MSGQHHKLALGVAVPAREDTPDEDTHDGVGGVRATTRTERAALNPVLIIPWDPSLNTPPGRHRGPGSGSAVTPITKSAR